MKTIFTGTGVAMITPFDQNNNIDFVSLKKTINFIIENGVDYILLMGTTSEAACMTDTEKKQVVETAIKEIRGKVPVMYGLGGNNTAEVLSRIKSTDFNGIDGILTVSPYYNKPNQEGLYRHFAEIAKISPVPVILYNVPGRTSVNITPETTLRLAHDFKNIVATKEASGSMDGIMKIIKDKPNGFTVISGDDGLTVPLISVGAEGIISVAANAFPKECSDMVRFAMNGDFTNASKIHYKLLDAVNLMFAEGNPTGVKAFMSELGIIQNYLRLPLVPASKDLVAKIKSLNSGS
ncbi:MAG: 4-hydroxy-tetrahydrodipicolinate synthase [Bacteroidales bacterium]|jgi:4-hydroxy-tetrahydrodipicolinate synthase|nr:4-hydroxy-tetrahydrodipicolinate synthase [Bacteroidales bacterium]